MRVDDVTLYFLTFHTSMFPLPAKDTLDELKEEVQRKREETQRSQQDMIDKQQLIRAAFELQSRLALQVEVLMQCSFKA